jgi:hypothetical protein
MKQKTTIRFPLRKHEALVCDHCMKLVTDCNHMFILKVNRKFEFPHQFLCQKCWEAQS